MTAALRFVGRNVARCLIGAPFATGVILAAIYLHEQIEGRRYQRNPNGPRGLFLETDEVIWKDEA